MRERKLRKDLHFTGTEPLYCDSFICHEHPAQIHLVEIVIAPAFRRRMFGLAILQQLCAYADAVGKPVDVTLATPANGLGTESLEALTKFYRRAGFEVAGLAGRYEPKKAETNVPNLD